MIDDKGIVYIVNKMGPRTDPCGTPKVVFVDGDVQLFMDTA